MRDCIQVKYIITVINKIICLFSPQVQFQFTLLTDTLYSPLPPDFLPMLEEEEEELIKESCAPPPPPTPPPPPPPFSLDEAIVVVIVEAVEDVEMDCC